MLRNAASSWELHIMILEAIAEMFDLQFGFIDTDTNKLNSSSHRLWERDKACIT